MFRFTKVLLALSFLSFGLFAQNTSDKLPSLTAEEIVSKHIASIGKASDIALVKSRVLIGTGEFYAKLTPSKANGPAQFAAEGNSFILALIFNANNYPSEKLAYDGDDLSGATLPGGGYSPLYNFLKSNKAIIKVGLFGGLFRTSWPLLATNNDVELKGAGTEKIAGKELYKVKVRTSGIGDMSITLFFEPETFHHVRTEYSYRIGQITAPNPNRPAGGPTAPQEFSLTEDFSNFSKVDNLTLPLSYTIEYSSNAGKPVVWTVNYAQAYNNQALEKAVFKVS